MTQRHNSQIMKNTCIVNTFYLSIADIHKKKYPHLEKRLLECVNTQCAEQIIDQLEQEEYLFRFHLCCMEGNSFKNALMFYLQAQISVSEEGKNQMLMCKEILRQLQGNYLQICESLLQNKFGIWQIYLLAAELISYNNIQESRKLIQKVIEINKYCAYAFIDLAFIYALEMNRQTALIQLKKFRSLNVSCKILCQAEVRILLLCNYYQECLDKIDKCSHLHNSLEFCQTEFKTKEQVDQAIKVIKKFKQVSPYSYHECYKLLKYLVKSKHYPINYRFIIIHNIHDLNEKFFRADLYCKIQDFDSCINSYKEIQNFLNLQSIQQQISEHIFGIKMSKEYNASLKQQLSYRIFSVLALSYRHANVNQLIQYCEKALKISQKYTLVEFFQDEILYCALAQTYLQKGNYKLALYYCQKSRKQQNLYMFGCFFVLAQLYYDLQNFPMSFQITKKIIEEQKQNAIIRYIYCYSLFKCGQITWALSQLEKSIHIYPSQKLFYYALGQIYISLGDLQKAFSALQKSRELNLQRNSFSGCYFQGGIQQLVGLIYFKSGHQQKAIQHLALAAEINILQSINILGDIYNSQGRYQDAMTLFQKKLPKQKDHKNYPQILSNMINQYVICNQLDKANSCLNQQNFQNKKELLYTRKAFFEIKRNNFQAAASHGYKAIELNLEYFQAYHVLALIYEFVQNQDLKSRIIRDITLLSKKNSQNCIVLLGISIFLSFIKNKSQSLKYFEKYFMLFKDYYENYRTLSIQLQFKVNLTIEKISKRVYLHQLFWLERFLLNKLLNNSQKCQQQLKYFFRSTQPVNAILLTLFNQIQQSFTKKQIVLEYLLFEMLKLDQEKGQIALEIMQKKMLKLQIVIKCIRLAIEQAVYKVQNLCIFMNQLLKKDKIKQKEYIMKHKISDQSQIVRNIKQILIMKQKISQNIQITQTSLIDKFIQREKKIKEIQGKQTHKISLLSQIFLKIHSQSIELKELQLEIKETIKNQNQKIIYRKIKKLILLYLSQDNLKNQLINEIYNSTYFLFQELDRINKLEQPLESIQSKMIVFFDNFRKKQYNFERLVSQINQFSLFRIIFQKNIIQQSQNFSFLSLSEITLENSEISQGRQKSKEEKSELPLKEINILSIKRYQGFYKFQDLKYIKNDELKYYDQQALKNINFLTRRQKINRIAYLLFKNSFDVMYQIKDNDSEYIPNYMFQFDGWNNAIIQKKYYRFSMAQGEPIQDKYDYLCNESLMNKCIQRSKLILKRDVSQQDIKTIDYLWREGPQEIIKFMICLIQGVSWLEQNNIIHLDLEPRNIIKVGIFYQIIDFDNAFMLDPNHVQTFKNLINIINHILLFNNKQQQEDLSQHISYLFRQIEQLQQIDKRALINICINHSKQVATLKIVEEFKKYAKIYHLKQLRRIMEFLIVQDILGKQLYKQIRQRVNLLCSGKIKFKPIVKKLQSLLIDKDFFWID